jgi:DNA-binding SARP family transcriptional activator/tetratricopeptide (TPR) repeat protein
MRFGLLGPLAITGDQGEAVEIRGRKTQTLVVGLLCHANQPITVEALVDALWGPTPPREARASLRVHVHHLRKALGESRIERGSEGYRLLVRPGELDVDRFRGLLAMGREAMSLDDPAKASEHFRAALALWRGPALAGFEGVDALATDAFSLEELRLDALEQRFEAELRLGWHSEISSELRALSKQYPFRETIQAQRMRALIAGNRSAEAVAVFEETRRMLADELGLDPGLQLRELHLSILRDDPTLQPAPAGPAGDVTEPTPVAPPPAGYVVPRQLPAQMTGFTGRSRYLRQLDALLSEEGDRPVAMPVATISGAAGIGKTTMAVHWAHHAAGRFPDGQLYINLHGFDPIRSPVEPATAFGLFLAALGVPARRVPVGVEERESLYRSLLADRRMLVVLDNAHDVGQVRPLLPGNAGCFVLVTSRNVLAGLVAAGAHPIVLDLLTSDEAFHLLTGRLGVRRIAAEPAAVADIVARCGGLPLPLSIVASRAALSEFPLSALVAELGQARRTLDSFASDDATIDLRAVFSWSYRVLSDSAARMFRLLALHPGPDATAPAAASLAGMPAEQARSALAELSAANLLTVASPGRYAYHDLVRAYAIELAESHDSAADRRDAVRRVLDHYVHTAYPAALLVEPTQTPTEVDAHRPGVVPEPFVDRQQALAWFDAEHAVILRAVARAADGFESHVWQLAWSAAIYLDRSGHWHDKIAVLRSALTAARLTDEQTMEARTLRSLGRTFGRLQQYDEAYEYLGEAIRRYRDLGNVSGQAHSITSYAEILEYEGRFQEALVMAEEAYDLLRTIENPRAEGQALSVIGDLHAQMGDYSQAIEVCQQALDRYVKIDYLHGQAAACDSLGVAYQNSGLHREAVAHYRRALDLLEETGERFFVAIVLSHLGDAYEVVGETPAARHAWLQALAIFTDLGAREAQGLRDKLVALDDRPAALVAQTNSGRDR